MSAKRDHDTRGRAADMDDYIDALLAGATDDPELRAATCTADFTFSGRRFLAKVVEVYDGDTVRVVFRHGGELVQYRARMAGYDSPEMKPPLANADRKTEIAAAKEAQAALVRKLGDMVVDIECGEFDKYGRLLVTVHTRATAAAPAENVNDWMIANGFGLPYGGGTKTPFRAAARD